MTPSLWFLRAGVLLALAAGSAVRGAGPNVVLIVTDDQGYGDLACHGNPWLRTPQLDRLHAEGACLTDYHVDPLCTPTRAALMTGRSCLRTGAWTVTEGRQLLDPRETTLADLFAAAGYRTALFGKWHLGDPYPYAPRYRGFQTVVRHRAGGVDEIGNPAGNDFFDDTYLRNGRPERFSGYCTDVWFDEAIAFIRRAGDERFFVTLTCNAMHSPHLVAEAYARPFRAQGHPDPRARFYGMIANFDENLGRLLRALRRWDHERDTLVVFMGDNGTAQGGTGRVEAEAGFNAGMRGRKGSVYEGGHRVPCLVRWPGHVPAGRRIASLTAHVDWLPTLVELCGLRVPAGVPLDGRSLAGLLTGANPAAPARTLFVDRQADALRSGLAAGRTRGLPQFAVLTERWRLVNGELYDLAADPGQRRDLAAEHPAIAARLGAAYRSHFAEMLRVAPSPRLFVGAPEENPTTFTVRDWHPTEGRVIWQPAQLADDRLVINGYWDLQVVRPGRYALCLARFPADAPRPMGAHAARLRVGGREHARTLKPTDSSVTFTVTLPAGPTRLQTWLTDAVGGRERGAYHITCRWLAGASNR